MREEAKQVAEEVASSPAMRTLARAGFVASAVVHVLLGILLLALAFGGRGDADQAGALRLIAGAPWGFAALWAMAIGLWALALWHVADGLALRDGNAARRWRQRGVQFAQALVFIALGFLAASVALGARPTSDEDAVDASREVLALPGGAWFLGGVGAAILGVGVGLMWIGARKSFRKKLRPLHGRSAKFVTAAGVLGYLGKGLALVAVGVLLLVAAVRVDPNAAGGLDTAFTALLGLPAGVIVVALIAVGLIAYAVFSGARARYGRF